MFKDFHFKAIAVNLFGGGFLAFGLYHVHSFAAVTEGGQLGLTLLLQHWLSVSPAISSLVINIICYTIGWKTMGKPFLIRSAGAAGGFSLTYWICEQFPPIWPNLVDYPLAAAFLGAVFVGIGTGLCVRFGGAPSGDDGLVMSLSNIFHIRLEYVYILFDVIILALSLTYIPLNRILYSLLTASLSSFMIGFVQRLGVRKEKTNEEKSL